MRWNKRLKLRRFSTLAIVASLALLILFSAFTLYGDKVGNFVIAIGDTNDGAELSLSMQEDLSDATSRLSVDMLTKQTNATYNWIPDDISKGLGTKNDTSQNFYSAFSFYLMNVSPSLPADYDMIVTVTDLVGDPLSVLRILIMVGDTDKSVGTVYAKAEETEEGAKRLQSTTTYTTVDLLDGTQIIKEHCYDLQPGEKTKYTVVMWIEGNDIDCTNDRLNDRIKLNMDFVGITNKK
jgi:hypothetical protein